MAATKIWAIKGSLRSLVDYVENPEKTMAASDAEMQGLFNVLDYAANSDKTEQKLFVSGVNCLPEIAIRQMIITKQQFSKTDKILAFHAYQSFRPGEVSPQQCHEIGVKLAREMWGERFQVVVATHLDRAHLHNHFAVNSVSFRDGGKYNSCKAATQRLRDVSDGLCREYGLSVIEKPGKSPSRMIYLAEKRGEPTRYNIYRQAIDRAIEGAVTKTQFESLLRKQGFEMKLSGKYWTIRIIDDKRATRIYHLGENYTGAAITKRILDGGLNKRRVIYEKPKQTMRKCKLQGNLLSVRKITGWRALYFYYLYRMGVLPKNRQRPPSHPILWEDVRQLRRYSAQIRLLCRNRIDTSAQLEVFVSTTQIRMDELIRQRTHIQNKLRRAKEPEDVENLKTQKSVLTEHISPMRRDLAVAAEIEGRVARMKEKLTMIREAELQMRPKEQTKQKGSRIYVR
ncbi:MAG: relaxase/mobilization nuclease domain-containing protein [Oscillospiraceae bacterium]|nr:relaxase/mobilization nuclease domain-containing protein [Oscillospiraceae bacterium]